MFLKALNLHKSIGTKDLFEDMSFIINKGEKVSLVGRNGLGKTTLLKIISGEDKDYTGEFEIKKGLRVIMTRQEHFLSEDVTPLDYVLNDVPHYRYLKNIISNPELSDDLEKIQEFSDAVVRFSELNFDYIEEEIIESLNSFQITIDQALDSMSKLSGGEKRFVELVRIMYSGSDVALIDEPTNHMDYVGKARFIEWMNNTKHTLFIVTHDRDVLKEVDKIYELRDKKIVGFTGNYDAYLKQNSLKTTTAITDYENGLKQLDKLHKQMLEARRRKLMAKSDNGRGIAKAQEEKFSRLYDELKESLEKPSFWIDQESLEDIADNVVDKYQKYKDKNINIKTHELNEHSKELLRIKSLSLGYDEPLFKDISFEVFHESRIFIKGRNGAGKSTLLKRVIEEVRYAHLDRDGKSTKEDKEKRSYLSNLFAGEIKISPKIRIGVYEQEIGHSYLQMTLSQGIRKIYDDLDIPVNDQKIKAVMGSYLFNPYDDFNLQISNLSGGQKARFQLIKMLANNPNVLILDEPTNHLDLPSIEELEKTLQGFKGGIIYVTHDNYLVEKLGGKTIEI